MAAPEFPRKESEGIEPVGLELDGYLLIAPGHWELPNETVTSLPLAILYVPM